MILTGHSIQPTYALSWSNVKPIIASGSRNGEIVVWDLSEFISAEQGYKKKEISMKDDIDDHGKRTKNKA